MMQINTNTPQKGWRPLKYIFFSPPKVGKSSLAAQFHPEGWKKVLIIDTENGTDELQCNRIKVQTKDEFAEALRVAYKTPVNQFGTIAIDVIDPIYEWANQLAVESYNVRRGAQLLDISEIEMGGGWALARKEFLRMIKPIDHLKAQGRTIVLCAHMKSPNDTMGLAKVRTIDLPGSLSRVVAGDMDAIGLLSVNKKGERSINFKPYELIDSGCRAPELANKTFILPENNPARGIIEAFELTKHKETPGNGKQIPQSVETG